MSASGLSVVRPLPHPAAALAAPVRSTALVMKVAHYQARDVLRSRWLASYVIFFLAVTEGLLRFAGGEVRAILSLASIVLYVVPLVTLWPDALKIVTLTPATAAPLEVTAPAIRPPAASEKLMLDVV